MEIIVGSIILKDNKILMVRESKEKCYGKLSFPAGHLKIGEKIFDGAKRETLEETGCKVELKKALPIFVHNDKDAKEKVILIHFLADLIEENLTYDTDEILETKWIEIKELKNMKKENFRSYPVLKSVIDSIESNNLYELEIFKNLPNI